MVKFNFKNLSLNLNTTILLSSTYNYNEDILFCLNHNYTYIAPHEPYIPQDIPNSLYSYFQVEYLKNKTQLTFLDELILNILAHLSNPSTLIFFDALTYLPHQFKNKLIAYLQKHAIHIINFTSDIEETLLLDYLIVLKDDQIAMEGPKQAILKEEQILQKLGYNLPFIVDLSNNLKYYNLTQETYYDIESLVHALWK